MIVIFSFAFLLDSLHTSRDEWQSAKIIFEAGTTLAVFDLIRGGATYADDQGDVALDDILFEIGCGKLFKLLYDIIIMFLYNTIVLLS